MAVSAFKVYNKGKKNISLTSGIILGTTAMVAHLAASGSNFGTATLSTLGSITSQLASGNNYKLSGKTLGNVKWSLLTSTMKFQVSAFIWTATGGVIPASGNNIKGLFIVATTGTSTKAPANKLLCYCSLSSTSFSISQNNTMTITPASTGVFTLV